MRVPRALALPVSFFILFTPLFAFAQPCPYTWTRTLKAGSTGDDVLTLQQFLNTNPDTTVALSGAGSAGAETTRFGTMTKAALITFQEKYSADILTPNGLGAGTGIAGPATRAKLNSLCAQPVSPIAEGSTSVSQTASAAAAIGSDMLTVSDPGQPASSLVPANAGVLFLSFTLTAGDRDVVVNGVTVERDGPGTDAPFSSLGLYGEDGLQIGNIVSFDSTHHATFTQKFTVPANTSQKFDVYVNTAADLTDYDGQAPHLELTAISASSPLSGGLPLRGAPQTMNASLVVGSALLARSPFDPGTSLTRYIGDTNIRFSGIRMTADSVEDLTLSNIIWEQTGTAGPVDLANVVTMVNGNPTPTIVRGRQYISIFDPAIVIRKGQSADVYVQGDLTATGSNRTVEFDIHDNTDDISLTGNTYGFAVGASPDGNIATAGHSVFLTDTGDASGNSRVPFYSGPVVTISPGAMITISR